MRIVRNLIYRIKTKKTQSQECKDQNTTHVIIIKQNINLTNFGMKEKKDANNRAEWWFQDRFKEGGILNNASL